MSSRPAAAGVLLQQHNNEDNKNNQGHLEPDVVASSPEVGFNQEIYDDLRKRFFEERVYWNEELPGGRTIRKQVKPPLIDTDQPGFKALKLRISQLEQVADHSEIYRLLIQLREWLINNRLPPCMRTTDSAVQESIDLYSIEDQEIIDADKYVVEELVVTKATHRIKTEEKDVTIEMGSGTAVKSEENKEIAVSGQDSESHSAGGHNASMGVEIEDNEMSTEPLDETGSTQGRAATEIEDSEESNEQFVLDKWVDNLKKQLSDEFKMDDRVVSIVMLSKEEFNESKTEGSLENWNTGLTIRGNEDGIGMSGLGCCGPGASFGSGSSEYAADFMLREVNPDGQFYVSPWAIFDPDGCPWEDGSDDIFHTTENVIRPIPGPWTQPRLVKVLDNISKVIHTEPSPDEFL